MPGEPLRLFGESLRRPSAQPAASEVAAAGAAPGGRVLDLRRVRGGRSGRGAGRVRGAVGLAGVPFRGSGATASVHVAVRGHAQLPQLHGGEDERRRLCAAPHLASDRQRPHPHPRRSLSAHLLGGTELHAPPDQEDGRHRDRGGEGSVHTAHGEQQSESWEHAHPHGAEHRTVSLEGSAFEWRAL